MLRSGRAIWRKHRRKLGARWLISWPRVVAGGRSVDVAILVVVGRVCVGPAVNVDHGSARPLGLDPAPYGAKLSRGAGVVVVVRAAFRHLSLSFRLIVHPQDHARRSSGVRLYGFACMGNPLASAFAPALAAASCRS